MGYKCFFPRGLGGNPFEQYQQRQQEAYQGLQSFFDQQRYMQQQHQILQSLNQCYAQLQQQHQDMATLQQQFQHLFTYNPSALGENNPSLHRPQTATPSIINNASPSFMSLPSHSVLQPPFSGPLFSQAPFTSAHQAPSSASMFRTAWHPQFGQQVRSFYDLSKHSSRIVKFYKKRGLSSGAQNCENEHTYEERQYSADGMVCSELL